MLLRHRPLGPFSVSNMQRALQAIPRRAVRPLLARPAESVAGKSSMIQVDSAKSAPITQHRLSVPTVQSMDCLAALFAAHIRPGDCYCLFGSVGAGKSVFSRAFIRAVAEDDFMPVPSPTFLLQNTYDEHQGPPIHHFDFYRLTSLQDFNRLDLEGSLLRAVCLMEWPERLPALPSQCLAIHIEVLDQQPNTSNPHKTDVATTSSSNGSSSGTSHVQRSRTPSRGRAFAVDGGYDSDSDAASYLNYSLPEDDTETDNDQYTDRRPRLVTLTPYGTYWEGRAKRILSYIAAHSYACDGLEVLDEPSDTAQPPTQPPPTVSPSGSAQGCIAGRSVGSGNSNGSL